MFLVRPTGALAGFVESIWLEIHADARPTIERILPRGVVDLIFEIGSVGASVRGSDLGAVGAVVVGPRTESFVLETPSGCRTLGVCLRLGGASALIGSAAHETRNLHVELTEFWGASARN